MPAGQFAAIRFPVTRLQDFSSVRVRVSADRPMRIWMQLRASGRPVDRVGTTFFVDTTERDVTLSLPGLTPVDPRVVDGAPLAEMDSLLFVVDTVQTLPGSAGVVRINALDLVR
jgi:hypothetical protein